MVRNTRYYIIPINEQALINALPHDGRQAEGKTKIYLREKKRL